MTQESTSSAPLLGGVLVVGGCGFLGFHLVRRLLQDEECGPVHVLDRNIENNLHEGAIYTKGNITDYDLVESLMKKINPRVIFHAASPVASLPASQAGEYWDTNVTGTTLLLRIASEWDSVKAFVFTSSVDAYADPPHCNVDESHPVWGLSSNTDEYSRTKAIADLRVRAANGPRLRTVSLLPGHLYGERYFQGLREILDMCYGRLWLFQIGDGENLMEVASTENVATAHLLAAKALLDPGRATGRVDGESFNISDGAPVPFWHHARMIWKTALGEKALKNVVIIPAWVMIAVASFVEWALWIFTFNIIEPPPSLGRTAVLYTVYTHTYSIRKARDRLHFRPVTDHDEVLIQAVRWELGRRQRLETENSKAKMG